MNAISREVDRHVHGFRIEPRSGHFDGGYPRVAQGRWSDTGPAGTPIGRAQQGVVVPPDRVIIPDTTCVLRADFQIAPDPGPAAGGVPSASAVRGPPDVAYPVGT